MANNGPEPAVSWNTTDNPFAIELSVAVGEMFNEMAIEGSNAQAVSDMAVAASDNVSAGDSELTTCANAMQSPSMTGSALSKAQAAFQALQTQVSVNNNDNSSITQAGSTEITNITQAIAQLTPLAQVANDNADATNSNITMWGS